jgi:hypothetical protein
MERITRKQLEGVFEAWCKAIGGRKATSYNDVGGYYLIANRPGDGMTRYSVEQVTGVTGGVRDVLYALGAREMYDKLHAGMTTMRESQAR